MKTHISMTIDPDLLYTIQELARINKRSLSGMVEVLLTDKVVPMTDSYIRCDGCGKSVAIECKCNEA